MMAADEQCLQIKRAFRFFHSLEEADCMQLAEYFECRCLAAGEELWREGERSHYVAFIVTGRIETQKETAFRGKQVVVGVYGQESLVGIVSILTDEPRPVTAKALEACQLLLLSRAAFDRINREEPQLGNRLLKGMLFCLSTRLKQSYERLAAIF